MGFFLKRTLWFGILGVLPAVLRALGKYLGGISFKFRGKEYRF